MNKAFHFKQQCEYTEKKFKWLISQQIDKSHNKPTTTISLNKPEIVLLQTIKEEPVNNASHKNITITPVDTTKSSTNLSNENIEVTPQNKKDIKTTTIISLNKPKNDINMLQTIKEPVNNGSHKNTTTIPVDTTNFSINLSNESIEVTPQNNDKANTSSINFNKDDDEISIININDSESDTDDDDSAKFDHTDIMFVAATVKVETSTHSSVVKPFLKTYGPAKKQFLIKTEDQKPIESQSILSEFKIISTEPQLLYDNRYTMPVIPLPPKSLPQENKLNIANTFQCEMCPNKKWYKRFNLINHFRSHHKAELPSKSQCPICKRWLTDLDEHMKYHDKPTISKCPICLKYSNNVNRHTRMVHRKEKRFVCDICDKKFFEFSSIKLHMEVHQKTDYQCKYCDIILKSFNQFLTHKRKFHPEMVFKRTILNENHPNDVKKKSAATRPYKKKNNKNYTQKYYIYKKKLKEDQLRSKLQPLCCQYCMKLSADEKAHADHENEHLNDGERKFKCKKCGNRVRKLGLHQIIHTEEKKKKITAKFQCSICGVKLRTKAYLTEHESKHNGTLFMCHICGKVLFNNDCLKLHIRCKHTNERPYKCMECNDLFISSIKRNRHGKKYNHKIE